MIIKNMYINMYMKRELIEICRDAARSVRKP